MSKSTDVYPDISDLLRRKAEGRKEAASRTLGEKIARMEAMRERLKPLKRLRESRKEPGGGESRTPKAK